MTDFRKKNFTVVLSSCNKLMIKSLKISSNLKHDATLLCEILPSTRSSADADKPARCV